MSHTCNTISVAESNRAQLRFLEECCMGAPVSASMAYDGTTFTTGDPIHTAKMKLLRYTGHGINAKITTTASTEIRADRQVSDLVQTKGTTDGNINFEFSAGEYDQLLEGALYSKWSTVNNSPDTARVAKGSTQSAAATVVYSAAMAGAIPTPPSGMGLTYVIISQVGSALDAKNLKVGCRVELASATKAEHAGYGMVVAMNVGKLNTAGTAVLSNSVTYLKDYYTTAPTSTNLTLSTGTANGDTITLVIMYVDGIARDQTNVYDVAAVTSDAITLRVPSYIRNGVIPHSYAIETQYQSTAKKVTIAHTGMRVSSMALNIAVGSIMTGNFNFKGTVSSAGDNVIPFTNPTEYASLLASILQRGTNKVNNAFALAFGSDTRGNYVDITANTPDGAVPTFAIGQIVFFRAQSGTDVPGVTPTVTITPDTSFISGVASDSAASVYTLNGASASTADSTQTNVASGASVPTAGVGSAVTVGLGFMDTATAAQAGAIYAIEIAGIDKTNARRYYYSLNNDPRYSGLRTSTRDVVLPTAFGDLRSNDMLRCLDYSIALTAADTISNTFLYAPATIASDVSDLTTPIAAPVIPATANMPMNGVTNFGALLLDNVPLSKSTLIKKLDLNIDNQLRELDSLGRLYAAGIAAGSVKTTLNFEAYFTDLSLYTRFVNDVYSGVSFFVKDPVANATYFIDIPKIKFTQANVAPGGGNQDVMIPINAEAVMGNADNNNIGYTIQITRF